MDFLFTEFEDSSYYDEHYTSDSDSDSSYDWDSETAGILEQQTGIVTGNYRIQRSTYGTYTSPRTVLFIHTRMRKHTNTVTHIPHPHHHENTKAVLNRMNQKIGHMEAVKTTIEDGRTAVKS